MAGVKVFGQGIEGISGWANPSLLPFDTILTDESGYFEFRSDYNLPNWNVQFRSIGYAFLTQSFYETDCQDLHEDFKLDQFATVKVITKDVPDLNYDTLLIFTLPAIYYDFEDGVEYGTDQLTMLPDETKEMWLRPDPEGLIRYWFKNDSQDQLFDHAKVAKPGELIEFIIEM